MREGIQRQSVVLGLAAIILTVAGFPVFGPLLLVAMFSERNEAKLTWYLLAACAAAGVLGPLLLSGQSLPADQRAGFLLMQWTPALVGFGGLAAFVFARGRRFPAWLALSALAGACLLLSLPQYLLIEGSDFGPGYLQSMEEFFSQILASAQLAENSDLVATYVEVYRLALSFFGVAQLGMLMIMLALGVALGRGFKKGNVANFLAAFKLPHSYVWVLIASWAAVLVLHFAGAASVAFFLANVAIALMLLYLLQGLGILQVWLRRKGVGATAAALYTAAMFLPVINVIALFFVPLLGISEIWIDYRSRMKEKSE